MSTREVNADRKGPKDLMDLANKAIAYKEVRDAKSAHDENPTPTSQSRIDDAFEHFTDLHRGNDGKVDVEDLNHTVNLLNAHIAKGKSH